MKARTSAVRRGAPVIAVAVASAVAVAVTTDAAPPQQALLALLVLCCVVLAVGRGQAVVASGPPSTQARWQHVVGELGRARRHVRPLALARVPLCGQVDAETVLRLEREVAAVLRATDAAWVQDSDLLLVLPEVTAAEGRSGIRRAVAVVGDRADARRAQVAGFPEDGLTLGALCDRIGARHPAPPRTPHPQVGAESLEVAS